ncbi:hypothetical protein J42TS3_21880 [Paenibacillus vini]|uniref:Uncharacterized protein n=1 Tax=Paenibacillus vini TaxID=1476024 RepID=A0ABQ4MB50_9BACL|nr:hypothetical protein J42TS3_21880 [Paenibacillus vini]
MNHHKKGLFPRHHNYDDGNSPFTCTSKELAVKPTGNSAFVSLGVQLTV